MCAMGWVVTPKIPFPRQISLKLFGHNKRNPYLCSEKTNNLS